MSLPEFCIKRPVFTWAIIFIMMIIGIVAYQRLSVRDLPDITKPLVMIRTQYSGADAKLVETRITTPLENAIAGVNGIDYIRSSSTQGNSRIMVTFKTNYDINVAINDIRDKINAIRPPLPADVSAPIISKADDTADPAIILAVTDKSRSPMALNDYATRYIQPELEQIEGVNNVNVWGDRAYTMRIMLNPLKMAAHGVAVNDLTKALQDQNTYTPGGQIQGDSRYYPLSTQANLYNAKQFSDLVVKSDNNHITRFGDVADVSIGPYTTDSAFRVNGKPAMAFSIIANSTANPIDVSNLVRQELKKLQNNLPQGMQVIVLYDNTTFIHASLSEVYRAIIEALILVTLVIFLFLGSWRATLIPAVTIPVCLISTFAILYAFGYSINIVTLLALVLAIGLVVDDAIVMLENIHRHIELGLSPLAAAIKGSKEIVFAIIAMTLTLVAVYLPTSFTEGLTGQIFSQFAVTLAGAVLISGFVALSLSPMMSARILSDRKHKSRYTQVLECNLERLIGSYKNLLRRVLTHRIWVVIALIILAAIGYGVYRSMPSELAPVEDQGYIMGYINPPPEASFAYADHYAHLVENVYEKNPNVSNYFMIVGENDDPSQVFSIATLKPMSKRAESQQQISRQLKQQMDNIAGVEAFPVIPPPLNQHSSSHRSLEIKILSADTLPNTINIANHFVTAISGFPGLRNVQNQTTLNSRLVNLKINRTEAADLQVNLSDITSAIATFYGGSSGDQHFEYDGQEYSVLLQLPKKDLKQLSSLNQIYIRNQVGKMIPLSNLVNVNTEIGSEEFPHYNRLRVATVTAELAPGYSMGQIVNYLQYQGQHALPDNAQYAFGGALKQFIETRSQMAGIFIFSLLFIYLVLAAQFESFIDPFVVLLSVPLSMLGGLLLLKLAGGSLNIFSEIGMVTLIGLISKHGILMTDFANKKRQEGEDLITAIVDAAALRLRPILMTTGAMVLGAIPLALASGAGNEARKPIGWVIVGGMLLGTFFSLFVVPVAYSYLNRFKRSSIAEQNDQKLGT